MKLLGKKATFVPCFKKEKDGNVKEDAEPVTGRITYVNWAHGWFRVSFHAGRTVLHESFKFFDIGKEVTVHG